MSDEAMLEVPTSKFACSCVAVPTSCTFRPGPQVQANCRALAARLVSHGYTLVTGGTDNHLILWDLRPEGISGSKMEKACDLCHITLNKNAVVGDVSAMNPGGVRIGAPGGAATCSLMILLSEPCLLVLTMAGLQQHENGLVLLPGLALCALCFHRRVRDT